MSKNGFVYKMKTDRGARAIALTVVLMLLVLTAIIVTTVIANRSTGDSIAPGPSDYAGVTDPDDTGAPDDGGSTTPPESQTPPEDDPKTDTPTDVIPSRFLLPVSGVLLKKHDADQQVFSGTMGDYRVHLGIDIATMAGANVVAMADGVISQVWEDVKMGQCVAIKHGGDCYTIYKNLSTELSDRVKEGSTVKAGDVIGTVGESAMVEITEEPHLHVEMTVAGLQVDPMEYFDEEAIATLNEDTNYEDVS